MVVTAQDKLDHFKHEWERLLLEHFPGMTGTQANKIVELASLRGLFDPMRTLFAIQDLLG